MQDGRVHAHIAREHQGQRRLLDDQVVEPLVRRLALHVADQAGTGHRRQHRHRLPHAVEQRRGHVEFEPAGGTVHRVVEQQDIGRARKRGARELQAERPAGRLLVAGQAGLNEELRLDIVGNEESNAHLVAVVGQLVIGDDSHRIAADQPRARPDDRTHTVAQLLRVVARCRKKQHQAGTLAAGLRQCGTRGLLAGRAGIRLVAETYAESACHVSWCNA